MFKNKKCETLKYFGLECEKEGDEGKNGAI